jgi:hypothetical protein
LASRTSKVSRACFQCTPIDVDEEMEKVDEIGGMNTQSKTSKQPKISPMFLSALGS